MLKWTVYKLRLLSTNCGIEFGKRQDYTIKANIRVRSVFNYKCFTPLIATDCLLTLMQLSSYRKRFQ